ncbi:MAG: CPBP family intramembrane metalloprotease, partial [Chloroflexota bacterium]
SRHGIDRGKFPFSLGNLVTFLLLYLVAGVILWTRAGPWEAVRHTIVNGGIVAAWLGVSAWILKNEPVPEPIPLRHPRLELAWGFAAYGLVVSVAAAGYMGWLSQARWLFLAAFYGPLILLYAIMRYPRRAIGLSWPSRRGWLALLAVILVNVLASAVFTMVPPGEVKAAAAADLSTQMTGLRAVLMMVLSVLVVAAIPEELLFRVTLLPRLARFIPVGWAILAQALLFSLGHLPQQVLRNQEPFLLAAAYLMTIDNGLIGGYLWYRTRSLPLLLVLHLFAYIRFGI